MKNINFFITIILAAAFFSCQKQQDEIVRPVQTSSIQSSEASKLITWDQLPNEFRNAVRIQSAAESLGNPSTSRSTSAIVETFGPYGSRVGTGFSYVPSDGSEVAAIGIGGNETYVTSLTVWYRNASGTLFRYQVGSEGPLAYHTFAADEYITGVRVRSSSFLNQLTIVTNKNFTITAGGTGGTYFERTALPGDWILGFWYWADNTRIWQIRFDVFCKPWQLLAGSGGRDIAVALDGTAYLTDVNSVIYKMPASGTTWQRLAGPGGVRIAANENRVCKIMGDGTIWEWYSGNWWPMAGSGGKDIAIDRDGTIWLVNVNGIIYRYNDALDKWDQMPGGGAARIAAGNGSVWMIDFLGAIYRYNNILRKWDGMPGSGGKDIAVGNDGTVWLTNVNGVIYNYNSLKRSWNELCGSAGSAIAANNKKVQLINTSGRIYKLTY